MSSILLEKKTGTPYLAQGALQLPQEVIITQVNGFVVDVINPKPQFLHHLKVIVDEKLFSKLWIEAILDFLCAPHLFRKKKREYLQHAHISRDPQAR